MSDLVFLFLFSFILLLTIFSVLCVFLYYFSTPAQHTRILCKQANSDYKNSRGRAHLQILRKGKANLTKKVNRLNNEIEKYQQALKILMKDEQIQLQQTLERQIAVNHLAEIPGIGSKIRSDLIEYIENKRIEDLKYAFSYIHGIGEARQSAINQWIKKWEQRIPFMLQEDFQGKKAIQQKFTAQQTKIESELETLQNKKNRWEEILATTNQEINKLTPVKMKHFQQAILQPSSRQDIVDHFIQGIFPEWEPIPEWFKELATLEDE